jgi:hypothetical protein
MGTSKSHGGPVDITKLLPSWAVGQEGAAPSNNEPEEDGGPAGGEAGGEGEETPDEDETPSPAAAAGDEGAVPAAEQQATDNPWRSAKILMGNAAQAGGDRDALRSAARAYTRARGGASQAAKTSNAGRNATARLGNFLSGLATKGLQDSLKDVGLSSTAGMDVREVFAAIANAIAPSGASVDEAIARRAVNEVLEKLYEECAAEENGIEKLGSMSVEAIREAIEASIAAYIYYRWLEELELRIERGAVSPEQAVHLENEMREYVRDIVHLDLRSIDVVSLDWRSQQGEQLISGLYEQAYTMLGGDL